MGIDFSINMIFIGIKLMFRNTFHKRLQENQAMHQSEEQSYHRNSGNDYSAVFSSSRILADDQPFTGANLNAVFGALVF